METEEQKPEPADGGTVHPTEVQNEDWMKNPSVTPLRTEQSQGKQNSDFFSQAKETRKAMQGFIDILGESDEPTSAAESILDGFSVRNIVKDTLTGAADMMESFQLAMEGKTVAPEKVFGATLDFAPGAVGGSMVAGTPGKGGKTLGIFAATLSNPQTAQKHMPKFQSAVDKSLKMKSEGAGTQEIFETTRLYEDAYGNWNFEIPDLEKNAKFDTEKINRLVSQGRFSGVREQKSWLRKISGTKVFDEDWYAPPVKLKDILDHPQLYEYTDLGDVNVRFSANPKAKGWGVSSGDNREITLEWQKIFDDVKAGKAVDYEGLDFETVFRDVMFHELQHQQQHSDNILLSMIGQTKAPGTSPMVGGKVLQVFEDLKGLYTGAKMKDFSPEDQELLRILIPIWRGFDEAARIVYPKSTEEYLKKPENRHFVTYFSEAGEAESRNAGRRSWNPDMAGIVPNATEDIPRFLQWNVDDLEKAIELARRRGTEIGQQLPAFYD